MIQRLNAFSSRLSKAEALEIFREFWKCAVHFQSRKLRGRSLHSPHRLQIPDEKLGKIPRKIDLFPYFFEPSFVTYFIK